MIAAAGLEQFLTWVADRSRQLGCAAPRMMPGTDLCVSDDANRLALLQQVLERWRICACSASRL